MDVKQRLKDWSSQNDVAASLLRAGRHFVQDRVMMMAAAVAFFTVLSLAPMLIAIVAIIGLAVGSNEAAKGWIEEGATSLVGAEGGATVASLIEQASAPEWSAIAGIAALVVLLFTAGSVFNHLKTALNTVWEVRRRPGRGIRGFVKDRIFASSLVIVVAAVLLASIALQSITLAAGTRMAAFVPGGAWLVSVANFAFAFVLATLVFAGVYRIVPDAKVGWRDVRAGAIATALLFVVGNFALSLYLGRAGATNAYGAAAGVVLLIVWVYYAMLIFLFGAEFTQAWATRHGRTVEPDEDAYRIPRRRTRGSGRPGSGA